MDDIDKIKQRIAKLLAMAADTSSPEEAAIAASRARALMDKHQIDAASLGSIKTEEFATGKAGQAYKYMPKWKSILSYAVGIYNDCQPELSYAGDYKFVVQYNGLAADVAMAVEMFERLCEAVDMWCKTYMSAQGYAGYMASIGNPYKYGMAKRLCEKFRALTDERDQITTAGGTSLVIMKTELVEQHFGKAVKPKNVKPRVTNKHAEQAYVRGWVDGGNVAINPQVDA